MIPNKIILTYKNYNIPIYVFENIQNLNPDKELLFFSDEDIVEFLSKEYDSSYVDFFNNLQVGCTKGDFFRYCYLFKYGGYYSDVDINHAIPIKDYIDSNTEFFTINSQAHTPEGGGTTFQALLFCESDHPIIKNCIEDLMQPESSEDVYHLTTLHMYENIKKYLHLSTNIPTGDYFMGTNKIVAIGQEKNVNGEWACIYKDELIAYSRYPTYRKIYGGTTKETGFFI